MTWQAMASIAASGEADWNAARMRYELDSLAFAFGCELKELIQNDVYCSRGVIL
jgi:hypothetical protein